MQAITVTLFQNESEHGTMSEVIIEKKPEWKPNYSERRQITSNDNWLNERRLHKWTYSYW